MIGRKENGMDPGQPDLASESFDSADRLVPKNADSVDPAEYLDEVSCEGGPNGAADPWHEIDSRHVGTRRCAAARSLEGPNSADLHLHDANPRDAMACWGSSALMKAVPMRTASTHAGSSSRSRRV